MNELHITEDQVKSLYETRFIKVFDLQYAEGKHYYDATRRNKEDLAAIKSEEEFKNMLPDAVTCIVVLKTSGEEPRLLMSYEYRYPTGHFLLSPPAGLIDPEDKGADEPQVVTAKREIFEETGIAVKDTDHVCLVNPCLFSTPGMTDESNALVAAVVDVPDLSVLKQTGAVGSERFDGFALLTEADARTILKDGRDANGHYYSVYTWAALLYFTAGLWKE